MAEFLTLDIDPLFAHELEYKFSRAKVDYETSEYDSGVTNARYVQDNTRGDTGGMVLNPDYVAPIYYNTIEAEALPSTFSSQNAIGTQQYSKDMSGYLNALSPNQLLSLGNDFNISGLARSDLSYVSPYVNGEYMPLSGFEGKDMNLQFSPDQLRTISKYRNTGGLAGASELGNIHGAFMPGEDELETVGLWNTRNYQDGIDDLYRYNDGEFVRAHTNSPGHAGNDWVGPVGKAMIATGASVIGGAALGAIGGAGAGTAGAGAGAGGGTAAGSTMGPIAELAAAQSAAGITSSAGGGAAALGGSTAAAGGLGPAGSPGGYNTGGYGPGNPGGGIISLDPSSAGAIDFGGGTDWVDMAKRAKKAYDMITGGGQPQQSVGGYQSGGAGNALGGSGGDYEAQNALGYTPYRLPARQNTLGYIDRLRSQ